MLSKLLYLFVLLFLSFLTCLTLTGTTVYSTSEQELGGGKNCHRKC